MEDYINIIGAGLAGSEAAYQIAKRGIKVKLYEMKPEKFSPAQKSAGFHQKPPAKRSTRTLPVRKASNPMLCEPPNESYVAFCLP